MREIKFRGWDGDALIYPEKVLMEPGEDGYVHLDHAIRILNQQTFEWMQYTGLKDKNGVEIYEGDILEWRLAYNRPDIVGTMVGRSAVIWEEAEVPYDNEAIRFVGFDLDWEQARYVEVVGNVHENPEKLREPYVCQHGLSFTGDDYCRLCLQNTLRAKSALTRTEAVNL